MFDEIKEADAYVRDYLLIQWMAVRFDIDEEVEYIYEKWNEWLTDKENEHAESSTNEEIVKSLPKTVSGNSDHVMAQMENMKLTILVDISRSLAQIADAMYYTTGGKKEGGDE